MTTALQPAEQDDDLLTRTEASDYLRRFHISMKPGTLARIWSVGGDGPPCQHIRGKPWYPRGALRCWAEGQTGRLRRSGRDRIEPDGPAKAGGAHGALD